VVVCDVDALPLEAAERLRDLVGHARNSRRADQAAAARGGPLLGFTAERFGDLPAPLAGLVDAVVQVAPLRERPDDVVPLARHLAAKARGRDVNVSAVAARALRDYAWPGNVTQLKRVVHDAAARADTIDLRHLPAELMSGTPRRLSRIETFERDEIVRVLTKPGITMKDATDELGISRATIYRKLAQYDLHIPRL
jgi:hypothetical protein